MNTFEEKYPDFDFRELVPPLVDDVDECDWLMGEMDDLIANIQAQIDEYKHCDDPEDRGEAWRVSAGRALKGAKRKRQATQNRRGEIKRKAQRPKRVVYLSPTDDTRAFVEASKSVLDKETYLRIWDVAHQQYPELFPAPQQGEG